MVASQEIRGAGATATGSPRRDRGRRHLLVLLVGLLLAVAGCLTLGDPDEDTRIEAEVKARLVAEKAANLTRLGVFSNGGSEDQRERAQEVAISVRGVRRVVNTLEVRPTPD